MASRRSDLFLELQRIDLCLRALETAPGVWDGEREELRETKGRIISALLRLNEHTYGACQRCEAEIDRARLDMAPWEEHCSACARDTARVAADPVAP